ncbi:MAG: glutamate--tRNA ligase [Euryarchaeota archaeon]|nr:glutamate--tRNA ligase [Euryarchaeota archaeon]
MHSDVRAEIRGFIERTALQNAVRHGAARPDAVAKRVFAEFPDLRQRSKEVLQWVAEGTTEVNKMGGEAARKRLQEVAPEMLEEPKHEARRGLPDLDPPPGKVVMRFAPNPNGPPTLGSARGLVVNAAYVKKYGGRLILRFDDTDPGTKKPLADAYRWYLEDAEWLGFKPDETIYASDRLDRYYEVAESLLQKGKAYYCTCPKDWFKSYRDAGQACKHRDQTREENLQGWKEMLAGNVKEGEGVLRMKTDMNHPNPAIRDWVAFRVIKASHPRVNHKYPVWPTLDFESAVEDHLLGTTHILRGKDLADSEARQRYLYEDLGWKYPHTLLWGKITVHEFGKFSTSMLRKEIEEGKYVGWDDPRLPTHRALRRRGIQPRAIWNFMVQMGLGENDVSASLENLYAENRKLVDPQAHRYFFVADPVPIEVEGLKAKTAKVPLHPDHPETTRTLKTNGTVLLAREDWQGRKPGDRLRLKNLGNIEIKSTQPPRAAFTGEALDKELPIVHWLPQKENLPLKVVTPTGETEGRGEKGIETEVDKVVQFERYGFVRIDSAGEGGVVVAYFTHE